MTDQEIQEANERLLRKREDQGVMTPLTRQTFSVPNDVTIGPMFTIPSLEEQEKRREREKERTDKEEAQKAELAKYLFDNPPMGFSPLKFNGCSMDTFKGGDGAKKGCMKFVLDYIETRRSIGIFFCGATGGGKTHLAIATAREMVRRGCFDPYSSIQFITMPELLLKIRATYSPGATQSETDVVEFYSKCGLLLLDDVGAEKISDFSITTLYLIIDKRNRELRPTLVTSNLNLNDIDTLIDARISSRLSEMKTINLAMGDYRKKR